MYTKNNNNNKKKYILDQKCERTKGNMINMHN